MILVGDRCENDPGSGTVGTRRRSHPGDRVLFGKWSSTEIKLDDEELLIMKESDLLGVIEGAPSLTNDR